MVVATRCPNPACKKYQLIEDADRGKSIACLICKQPIKVPADTAIPPASKPSSTTIPKARPGDVNLEM